MCYLIDSTLCGNRKLTSVKPITYSACRLADTPPDYFISNTDEKPRQDFYCSASQHKCSSNMWRIAEYLDNLPENAEPVTFLFNMYESRQMGLLQSD